MRNVVVLCVVYASLVSAGFFTPSPKKQIIDKEGVVIGIEDDDNGNTKVKISPHEVDPHREGVLASAKEKIKEAASSVVPEVMKKGGDNVNQEKDDKSRPGEKINSYTAKTKEATNEAVKEGTGKVKDGVAEVAQKSKEKGKAAEEKVRTQGKKGLKRVFWYIISPMSLHLLGFATAYGMCVWVTLGSNYVLSKALPRQQLATVQSRVYPLYLKAMASSVGLAFLGSIMDRTTPFDLLASLLMILVNLLYLEPRATKVLFERMRKEKEEGGDADLRKKQEEEQARAAGGGGKVVQNVRNLLGGLNSYSSMLNIATLMPLTWHLVNLGQHLHAQC